MWHERKREQHLAPYHRRHPACGEINVIRDAPRPASIWRWSRTERREYKKLQIQPHVLRGPTPGLIPSLSCVLHLHTRTSFDLLSHRCALSCLLSSLSQAERLEPRGAPWFKPPDQDGGYTVHLSSVVYNVICTFNLHLGGTLL